MQRISCHHHLLCLLFQARNIRVQTANDLEAESVQRAYPAVRSVCRYGRTYVSHSLAVSTPIETRNGAVIQHLSRSDSTRFILMRLLEKRTEVKNEMIYTLLHCSKLKI